MPFLKQGLYLVFTYNYGYFLPIQYIQIAFTISICPCFPGYDICNVVDGLCNHDLQG